MIKFFELIFMENRMKKSLKLILFAVFVSNLLTVCAYHIVKPNPKGSNYRSALYRVSEDNIDFYYDVTYMDSTGEHHSEQEIFDSLFAQINKAEHYILTDMFLFNPYLGKSESEFRDLSGELASRLIKKKKENPDIMIDFITDPVNNVYGGAKHKLTNEMKKAGINVIYTDLNKLKDSNVIYSFIWRTLFQWFGNSQRFATLKHPFDSKGDKVTIRSYLSLLNFKANHRKLLVADDGDDMISIITSANPHNGSAAHSNVAVRIKGDFWKELYKSEDFVAEFSKEDLNEMILEPGSSIKDSSSLSLGVKLITEKKIRDELLRSIDSTTEGDSLFIGMFYLSERKLIKSMIRASKR